MRRRVKWGKTADHCPSPSPASLIPTPTHCSLFSTCSLDLTSVLPGEVIHLAYVYVCLSVCLLASARLRLISTCMYKYMVLGPDVAGTRYFFIGCVPSVAKFLSWHKSTRNTRIFKNLPKHSEDESYSVQVTLLGVGTYLTSPSTWKSWNRPHTSPISDLNPQVPEPNNLTWANA